jgi:glycosyltransferase involved in cell wall biosynthesis
MTIAFVHGNKAFLPEIEAYTRFFAGHGVRCVVTTPDYLVSVSREVEWFFMGTDFTKRHPGIYRVHEYASLSVPPAQQVKDWFKRNFVTRPDYRLFLNAYVQQSLGFRDKVPFGLRDMGLWPEQLHPVARTASPGYDFIYVGSVTKDTHIENLLDCFVTGAPMDGHSLLIVSRDYELLRTKYQTSSNISFTGPVAQTEVAALVQSARFAINYKPDIAPHNQQTSTKLLEYAACGVPVITTEFAWMRNFQQQYGGNYFYLSPNLSNFSWEKVNAFNYSFPDLSAWTWEQQIRSSGILEFLAIL